MLVMVVFFIAFRWIHLSTPLIRLFLLVLILLLMPTLNFLPVWFALSLLRFRLPSRLPMMFILWMVKIMSNIQTGAERMPHDLSHLGFLAGQIGRLITISTTPVIAGDSFEMDAVGALRLSPLRRGLAIDSTVDIFTFYVPHRHVYGEQ